MSDIVALSDNVKLSKDSLELDSVNSSITSLESNVSTLNNLIRHITLGNNESCNLGVHSAFILGMPSQGGVECVMACYNAKLNVNWIVNTTGSAPTISNDSSGNIIIKSNSSWATNWVVITNWF